MTSISKKARIAGLVYFLCILVAPYRLIYVPNALFVTGNAAATAANIAGHETLFRLGIFSDLLTGVIQIFLALALYRLFEEVNRRQAVLMVILGGVMISAIYFVNVITRVRQFALEFRSFRLWNHGGMRVFGPDFINAL